MFALLGTAGATGTSAEIILGSCSLRAYEARNQTIESTCAINTKLNAPNYARTTYSIQSSVPSEVRTHGTVPDL